MTIAFWCVLIAGLMPFVAVGIAKYDRSYNNRAPRDWLAKQDGMKKRAYAAHLNCFEAFPLFASGVIIAHLAAVPAAIVSTLAALFIAVRIIYLYCYLSDRASLRSLIWLAGLGLCVALFIVSAAAKAG